MLMNFIIPSVQRGSGHSTVNCIGFINNIAHSLAFYYQILIGWFKLAVSNKFLYPISNLNFPNRQWVQCLIPLDPCT